MDKGISRLLVVTVAHRVTDFVSTSLIPAASILQVKFIMPRLFENEVHCS